MTTIIKLLIKNNCYILAEKVSKLNLKVSNIKVYSLKHSTQDIQAINKFLYYRKATATLQTDSIKSINEIFKWIKDTLQENSIPLDKWKVDTSESTADWWRVSTDFKSKKFKVKNRFSKGVVEIFTKKDGSVVFTLQPDQSIVRGLFGNAKNLKNLMVKLIPLVMQNKVTKKNLQQYVDKFAKIPKDLNFDLYTFEKALVDWVNQDVYAKKAGKILLALSPDFPTKIKSSPSTLYRTIKIKNKAFKKLLKGDPLKLKSRFASSWSDSEKNSKNFANLNLNLTGDDVIILVKKKIPKQAIILNIQKAGKWLNKMGTTVPTDIIEDETEIIVDDNKANLQSIDSKDIISYTLQKNKWEEFKTVNNK